MDNLLYYLDKAKKCLELYYEQNKHTNYISYNNTPIDYFKWIDTKTKMLINSKNTYFHSNQKLVRGDVVWVEFGFNIGNEFSGRHPAVILKNGGKTLLVIPITSKQPTAKQLSSKIYVELNHIYNFKPLRRWVNIFNIIPISIQRIDFKAKKGNLKGIDLNNISNAFMQSDLFKYIPPK